MGRPSLKTALVWAAAVLVAVGPLLVTDRFVIKVLTFVGLNALVVTGLALLFGYAGQVSLGHAGFVGLGAYTAAYLTARLDLPWPVAFFAAGAVAALGGLLLALPSLRLKGHYLAMATLGFGELMTLAFVEAEPLTGGVNGFTGIPFPSVGAFELREPAQLYWLVWGVVGVALLLATNLTSLRPGRAMRAMHGSELGATACGVDIVGVKVRAFVMSAALAGLSGALYAGVVGFISPSVFTRLGVGDVPCHGRHRRVGVACGPARRGGRAHAHPVPGRAGARSLARDGAAAPGVPGRHLRSGHRDRRAVRARRDRRAVQAGQQGRRGPVTLLSVREVTKRFGGLVAVDGVSFDVHEGTIKALIGPNGAGKSTLFNALTGFDRPDEGSVTFDGTETVGARPRDVVKAGLARTFQNTQLFDGMTALENVMVGAQARQRRGFAGERAQAAVGGGAGPRRPRRKRRRLLRLIGIEEWAHTPAADLPAGIRRLLEIARALATQPKMLLLDEPAAGLNATETQELVNTLYRVRDSGITVLVVEHDMGLVMEVSDEIVVIDRGRKIAEGPPRMIQKDPAVIAAYLGEEDADE